MLFSSVPPKLLSFGIVLSQPGLFQNLKAEVLSEKAGNTAVSSNPPGESQGSLLAPDVKEQLWGGPIWSEAKSGKMQNKGQKTGKWHGR